MIYLSQPGTVVTTWRTLWPGLELRRRGYEVQIDAMDAGYVPEAPPPGALVVVHISPSAWDRPETREKLETTMNAAGTLVLSFDDDWTAELDEGGL